MGNHLLQRVYGGKCFSARVNVELRGELSHKLQSFNSRYGPLARQAWVWSFLETLHAFLSEQSF